MKDRLKKTYKNSVKGPKVHSEVKTDEKKERHPPTWLMGMENGAAAPEDSLTIPQKVKHKIILRPSNSTTRLMPERIQKRNSNT